MALLASGLFAGLYGAVHSQISYTICPEYFTQFKFHQFDIDERFPDRIGAAIVGQHAAWWMGIAIGVVLIPMGLVLRGNANYFWSMIRVFGIVAITTLVVGATPVYLRGITETISEGFFRTDLAFASGHEQSPLIILGTETAGAVKTEKFQKIDLKPINS